MQMQIRAIMGFSMFEGESHNHVRQQLDHSY